MYSAHIGVATKELPSELRSCEVVLLIFERPESIGEGPEVGCGALVGAHNCQRAVGILNQVPQNVSVDLVLELLRKSLEATAVVELASAAVAVGLSRC